MISIEGTRNQVNKHKNIRLDIYDNKLKEVRNVNR